MTEVDRTPKPCLRIGSLFSGYGGLDEGVRAVLGGTVAWHCEIDPGASRILAHRYPDVPNHGDITQVDWGAVEPVDVLTGGFPCQDVSLAGLRRGMRPDTRSGLWSQMAYAIDQLRPSLVVIENVRGLLSADAHGSLEPCPWCVGDDGGVPLRALGGVLADLAALGFDAEWVGLRAADVGAPHGRFRVFVTAWPAGTDPTALGRRPQGWDERVRAAGLVPGADAAADAHGDPLRAPAVAVTGGGGPAVAGHAGAQPAADPENHRLAPLFPGGHEPQGSRAARGHQTPADPGRVRGHQGRRAVTGEAPRGGALGEPAGRGDIAAADTGSGGRGALLADVRTGEPHPGGGAVPDTTGDRRDEGRPEPAGLVGGPDAAVGGDAASDSGGDGRERRPQRHERTTRGLEAPHRDDAHGRGQVDWGEYEPAIRCWEHLTGRPAPSPHMIGSKGGIQLAPVFSEWLMHLPPGWVTDPAIWAGLTPSAARNAQLKALGNGVVWSQAAEAVRTLLARIRAEQVAA